MNILTPDLHGAVRFCVTPLQLERKNEFGVKFPSFPSFPLCSLAVPLNAGLGSVTEFCCLLECSGTHEEQV